jgi:hypothetical protein
LTYGESESHVRAASGEHTVEFTSTRFKEIVMNTSKVIELGKVSEETKGVGIGAELPGQPFSGHHG